MTRPVPSQPQPQPHSSLSILSSTPTVCPAFTRWMQRRVFKAPVVATKANRQSVSQTPPSDEELNVAALQELRLRLTCRNRFLNLFLEQLQQDPLVTAAWLSPLPRPETPTQPSVWARPIDDIWRAAKQAARDPLIAHHERELAFVATLVLPLMDDSIFRFGYTHEDLHLVERIKVTRRACSPEDASQETALFAQAALLKSLLAPDQIDCEAESIDLPQRHRICNAVDNALNVLRMNWNEPEPIKPMIRTCLMPRRTRAKPLPQKS